MNKGEFYSRDINYKSWGYDNYYGLQDIQKYNDERYVLDRELILNKTFYNKIFKQQGNFVNYIITYSPHTPFTTEKEVGKILAEEKYGKGNIPKLSEEDCAKMAASETDNMVGLLIQALKDNGLYDNTVIVAYADHYLYTLDDKSILDKYKETSNNLINHTPFFIWSSDLGQLTSISKVNMQMDILPTVLNLFGIDYNSNNYIGHDILSNDFKGYAFFSDYSWYDGKVYVENQQITNGKKMSKNKLDSMNNLISDVIKKNDLTLKYDYFKSK
jgi:lipoteichoic acid synthase